MRKILTLILVLALTVVMFASCSEISQMFPGIFPGQEPTEHEHAYVDGKCECGESDPNYVPTPEVDELLQAASDYIRQMYKDNAVDTAEDYKLIGLVPVGDVVFEVVWTTDSDEILVTVNENGEVTIDVPDESAKEIPYVLTATITNDKGETAQRTFNRRVPKFAVNSFAEYMAAVEGDSVIIQGTVVAINSKAAGNTRNHLFILDENGEGGYYSYQMDQDPVAELGIEIGMTVRVSGPVAPYNGMQEIKGGTAKIVDSTIKSFEYIDITDKFVEGTNFNELVALPVIIKGVTLGGQELEVSTSQYLFFSLNGVESYVRTYITDFPTTLSKDKKAEIDALHAANRGNIADVYGILITYSGKPYIIPTAVDCFNNIQVPERTDAEKIELELGALTMNGKFTSDTVLDLVLSGVAYDAVKFAWTSDSQYAVVADGKLTITVPDDETVVTLTVTATCGEATATKEFKITLSKSITSISDALAIGGAKDHNTYTPDKYLVAGIIKEVYNAQYGNMYLVDAEGNQITIYGTYSADGSLRYDAMENAPKAGDYVVILGVLGQYNGTAQMKNGWIVSVADSLTVPEAGQLGASQEHNTYTPDKYIVTGTVTEIANTTYGNLYIKDAEGNTLYIYGLYDATGKVRFDKMTTQPKVGDTVIVYSAVGQYNGTAQLKNAWLVGLTAGADTPAPHEHKFVEGKCECGETDPNYVPPTVDPDPKPESGEIVFDFGANGDAAHVDGTEIAGGTITFTSGNYSLVLTDVSKVYSGAFDAKGNSAIKFGTSSLAGTMTFVVPENVTSVIIYAAKYKSYNDNNLLEVNGVQYALNGGSNEGEYDAITIDTTTVKTITVASAKTSGKARCMINTIVWVTGDAGSDTPVDPQPPVHEHNFVEGKCECGETDPNYVPPVVDPVVPTYPVVAELKTGDKIIIGAPAYGKLLSMVKVATYYNKGVNYSATDFSNVTNDEIFVVTVNDDGSIELVSLSGQVVAIGGYSSLDVTGANKTWAVEAKSGAEGIVYLKNIGTGKYLEWYASKDNWSSYAGTLSDLFELNFYLYEAAEGGDTPVDPQPPVHEHSFVEGKCECGETDPNYVPPVVDPETPVVSGGSADFDTIVLPSNKQNGDSSYTATYTTANGWTSVNSAIQCGGAADINPQFTVIGPDNTHKAICINGGKTVGSLTSPTLNGGISKFTMLYTKMFTDTKLGVTITITDVATGAKYTKVLSVELPKDEKYQVYTLEWVLDTPITGDFTIEIVNDCPSANTSSNKDRITVLDISWIA